MKRWIIIIVNVIVYSLDGYACKCQLLSFKREVTQADQIFTGKVIKKTIGENVHYLFMVSEMFKGEKNDTITITTYSDFIACGMEFGIGKEYLVYSNKKYTSRCRRNAEAKNNPDIEKLRRKIKNQTR
jgi:hypothetical protein